MARVGDTSTLAGAMHELDRRGFVEHFMLTNGGLLGLPSGKKFRPDEIKVSEVYRFEGISDPGDMSVLYALETRSGLHGTLVDAFGVYADPGVGAFMKEVALRRRR
jgi:hypothetical protein